MALFKDIVRIIRRGKNNNNENKLTKRIAKETALDDIRKYKKDKKHNDDRRVNTRTDVN